MEPILAVFKREFAAYSATPLAYVFIWIFLFAMGAFIHIGHFFETHGTDLQVFLRFPPVALLLSTFLRSRMRLVGSRSAALGTMELLLTLPLRLSATSSENISQAGAFTGVALA